MPVNRRLVLALALCVVGCVHAPVDPDEYCQFDSIPMGPGRFRLEMAVQVGSGSYSAPSSCFYRRALKMCVSSGYNSFVVDNTDESTRWKEIGVVTCETR